MKHDNCTTLNRIHEAGKQEFLKKGFRMASLRNIVKIAGVTTGAFYGYYDSKEELFHALVGEPYDTIMKIYKEAQERFAKLSPSEQRDNMGKISGDCMACMMEYIYEHKDEFRLILCCSEGTRYEHMLDEMVEVEIQATHTFADILQQMGYPAYIMEPQLEHMLVSGMFSAFFEMIIHDVPYAKASEYLRQLRVFYSAGWQKIMGI